MESYVRSTETTVDHIGLVVRDIAALRETYLRLGFTVTKAVPVMQPAPDGQGEVPLGQVSARVMFGENFIELVAVRHPGQGNALDRWLERREGMHILAFRAEDAARSMRELINAGLVMSPLREASHRVSDGKGGQIARYKWFTLPESIAREGMAIVVEHLTPAALFTPTLAHHGNRANGLRSVFAVVENLDEAFGRYTRLPGTKKTSFMVGRTIAMRNQQFVVVEPKGFAALFPGTTAPTPPALGAYSLSVDDLEATRATLKDAGIPFQPWGTGGIWVAPEYAGGAVLVFAENAPA